MNSYIGCRYTGVSDLNILQVVTYTRDASGAMK